MIPLLIIGGGMQGIIFALAFSRRLGSEYVRVLDPHTEPRAVWRHNSHACAMHYLRSPGAHNIESDPLALFAFARQKRGGFPFRALYRRPSLALFEAHCQQVIEQHTLEALYLQGRATKIIFGKHHVEVESSNGTLQARRVLLALGKSAYLHIPEWCRQEQEWEQSTATIHHIYDLDFRREWAEQAQQPIIIGGGLSAAQLLLHLGYCRPSGGQPPIMVARHSLRSAHFDSDPCYLGPKCLSTFLKERNYATRRQFIMHSRNRGSLPPDTLQKLKQALKEGHCRQIEGEPQAIGKAAQKATLNRMVTLQLSNGEQLFSDCLLLATGFEEMMPQEPLIVETARRYGLARDSHGTPLVDWALRWHPRLLLSGDPAMLELGPAAPNIIGAHLALRRLLPFLTEQKNDGRSRLTAPWRPVAPLATGA